MWNDLRSSMYAHTIILLHSLLYNKICQGGSLDGRKNSQGSIPSRSSTRMESHPANPLARLHGNEAGTQIP
jgi:hypothetical protein